MNYEKLKKEVIPLQSALNQIMVNDGVAYKWFAVDNGVCRFELGGSHRKGELMITARLFHKDQGKIMIHSDGFIVSGPSIHYESLPSIDNPSEGAFKISLPDVNGKYQKMKLVEFLRILKTDLYQIRYDVEETHSSTPTARLIIIKG